MSDEFAYVSHFDSYIGTSNSNFFFCFQIGMRFAQKQEPLPYLVSQPLPWQVHSVSHSRRSSKADEVSCNETCTLVWLLLMHQGNSTQLIQASFILHMTESSTITTSSPVDIVSTGDSGLPFYRNIDGSFWGKGQVICSAIWTSPMSVAGIFTHKWAFLIFCYLPARQSMWKVHHSSLTQHVSIWTWSHVLFLVIVSQRRKIKLSVASNSVKQWPFGPQWINVSESINPCSEINTVHILTVIWLFHRRSDYGFVN